MVSAYIRIAHKYQMDAILGHWLGYLKKHFSKRFADWIAHERMVPEGFEPIHAIGVVNLARLTGCDDILPTALAVCTTLGTDIVTGFAREDGTYEQLSMADLGRCFRGRGLLIQANATAVSLALSTEPGRCDDCHVSDKIQSFTEEATSMYEIGLFAPEGLVPAWKTYGSILGEDSSVCCTCLKARQKAYHDAQQEAWMRLPEFMGVTVNGWPGFWMHDIIPKHL